MDQSFSVKNLNEVLLDDMKNGGNLEERYMPEAFVIKKKIKKLNDRRYYSRRLLRTKKITSEFYNKRLSRLNNIADERSLQYKCATNKVLEVVSKNIVSKEFRLNVNVLPNEISGKKVYGIENCLDQILVVRIIQKLMRVLYDIRMPSRDTIVGQIKSIIFDGVPKYILRTDIKSFYESIEHKRLLNIIHESPKLSAITKRILTRLIRDYSNLVSSDGIGLPRGIGLSAYLAEIYLLDVDYNIKKNRDLIYYARYVDDVILIYAPEREESASKYKNEIQSIVNKSGLFLNESKTKEIDLLGADVNKVLDYLGYKFKFQNKEILLSSNRILKYRDRINQSFDDYKRKRLVAPKKAADELISRFIFITGNVRLFNKKSNAFIGVYFSNKYITNTSQLKGLDEFYYAKINREILPSCSSHRAIKRNLEKLSFQDGFNKKLFGGLSKESILIISKGWKK